MAREINYGPKVVFKVLPYELARRATIISLSLVVVV
jgi:hypothetical protein